MPVIGGPPLPITGIGTPQVILWSALNNAYSPRPVGLPAGLGWYVGPVRSTDANSGGSGMVDGDMWFDAS